MGDSAPRAGTGGWDDARILLGAARGWDKAFFLPAPVRWTERGVVVGYADPERATWRPPHDADGLRRDGLPNGGAQGGSIWARAAKGIGRTDRGPATGHDHDAAHRTPRRLTGHR